MSTIDLDSLEFVVRDKPQRSREGTATVITSELLQRLADGIKSLPDGQLLEVPIERPTPGSAAGMGYQIKVRLARDPYSLNVKSIPVPADQEAWDALMEGKDVKEQAAEVKRIKDGGTADEKAAIVHHLGFTKAKGV